MFTKLSLRCIYKYLVANNLTIEFSEKRGLQKIFALNIVHAGKKYFLQGPLRSFLREYFCNTASNFRNEFE